MKSKALGSVAATRPAVHLFCLFCVLEKVLQMSLSAVSPPFIECAQSGQ